jgi:hypothetical protein
MRKFHAIAALCKDGRRPELQALFDCVWSKPVRPPSETALVVLVRADEPASVTVRSLGHCRRMAGRRTAPTARSLYRAGPSQEADDRTPSKASNSGTKISATR